MARASLDGIPVDVRRHWRGVTVEDRGARARCAGNRPRSRQPGTGPGYAGRLGPDPASTDIACVGGVIANNSGGMRCGVTHDSYRTVSAMTFVLPPAP